MTKVLVVQVGKYLIGISNDEVSRVGKLKDDFTLSFKHFETWNILPLHRHLGYPNFPNNRRYLIFLKDGKIIFADSVLKIILVNLSDTLKLPLIANTKRGKILIINPDTASAKQLRRFLVTLNKDFIKPAVISEKEIEQKNTDISEPSTTISGFPQPENMNLQNGDRTLSGGGESFTQENVTYQEYPENQSNGFAQMTDLNAVIKDFHIITLGSHLEGEKSSPPQMGNFSNLKDILSEDERLKLGGEKDTEIYSAAAIPDEDIENVKKNSSSNDALFNGNMIPPEDDVEIVVDEENFLNGKVKDDFSIPAMEDYVDETGVFINNQGVMVTFEEIPVMQKGTRENSGSSSSKSESEQDDEDGCKSCKNSLETEISENSVNFTETPQEENLEIKANSEENEERHIEQAFFETIEHEKTGSAFNDIFGKQNDIVKPGNALDGESVEVNEEQDVLTSDISSDYNGIIEEEPEDEQKTNIIKFSKPQDTTDGRYSDDEDTDFDDNGKRSYIDRRDDAIEQIRQEILKAKQQAGGDSVTDIELIKRMLEKERKSISEKSAEKEPSKISRVKKKHSRIKKKKRRSFNLWLREMVFSAPFKITLVLILIFAASISGIYLFERIKNKDMFKNVWDAFWYTIVTFTTVGYGDKYPTSFGGQIVGIFMMFVGVTMFSVISGRITSYLVDLQIKRGKGLIKLQKLTNHFVICGWRKDFHLILDEILLANKDITNDEIVLINDVAIENMESVMSEEKYRGINYIRGDFLDESVLNRANIAKAKKALILADNSHDFSPQEADSRTVMAAITMEAINKNIYVCAELLDSKFERYLKLAHVEEIILSRDYSRTLLANASAATGISHIITSLVSTLAEKGLTTENVPEEFVGDTFEALSMYFLDRDGSILIGLLENTGNFHKRKKEALTEAQKTPDISKLVENLKTVKFLQANQPVINPGGDYVIADHCRAIIIEGVSKIEKEAIFGT